MCRSAMVTIGWGIRPHGHGYDAAAVARDLGVAEAYGGVAALGLDLYLTEHHCAIMAPVKFCHDWSDGEEVSALELAQAGDVSARCIMQLIQLAGRMGWLPPALLCLCDYA